MIAGSCGAAEAVEEDDDDGVVVVEEDDDEGNDYEDDRYYPLISYEPAQFVEEGGKVRRLRRGLREALPGAPSKQPNNLHASLLRLLSPATLPADAVERVDRACDEWTQKLRGQAWEPEYLWYVLAREFAPVNGEKPRYRLQ